MLYEMLVRAGCAEYWTNVDGTWNYAIDESCVDRKTLNYLRSLGMFKMEYGSGQNMIFTLTIDEDYVHACLDSDEAVVGPDFLETCIRELGEEITDWIRDHIKSKWNRQ